jgi:hypothetical protein
VLEVESEGIMVLYKQETLHSQCQAGLIKVTLGSFSASRVMVIIPFFLGFPFTSFSYAFRLGKVGKEVQAQGMHMPMAHIDDSEQPQSSLTGASDSLIVRVRRRG